MKPIPFWKRWQLIVPVCLIIGYCFCWWPCKWSNTSTVVYLVRHAEKGTEPAGDPLLTVAGTARANELARVLAGCGLQVVHHTEAQRTRLTVAPAASAAGLNPVVFNSGDTDALVAAITGADRGKVVLVAGHSNTVPDIIQLLTGEMVPEITETQFDNLYQVILPRCGSKRVLRMKYGAPSN